MTYLIQTHHLSAQSLENNFAAPQETLVAASNSNDDVIVIPRPRTLWPELPSNGLSMAV